MTITTGRSSERRRIRVVWMWLEAPKPSMPRTTVAPASPACVRPFHDLGVQRPMVVLVSFPDVDREAFPGTFELHRASLGR